MQEQILLKGKLAKLHFPDEIFSFILLKEKKKKRKVMLGGNCRHL